MSFRQGLTNLVAMESFRRFLLSEMDEEKVFQGRPNPKRLLGSKVVTITKLLTDLDFWFEVMR